MRLGHWVRRTVTYVIPARDFLKAGMRYPEVPVPPIAKLISDRTPGGDLRVTVQYPEWIPDE